MRSRPARVFAFWSVVAIALTTSGTTIGAGGAQAPVRPPTAELLERYERGQWAAASVEGLPEGALASTLDDLKRVAPVWIRARGEEHVARRRLAVATYLLEMLRSQAASAASQNELPAMHELIEWGCTLLREGPALPAERQWHLASLGLLETYFAAGGDPLDPPDVPSTFLSGSISRLENESNSLMRHAEHSRARFPSDAAWTLIAAIGLESNTWLSRRARLPYLPSEELIRSIVSRYRDAAAQPSTRAEALARLGYFELRRGRTREALSALEQAGTPDDPVVRYWIFLFKGQALKASRKQPEAIAAYRTALQAVPGAQAATTALGALLATSGSNAEATTMLQQMLGAPSIPVDPWILYLSPDIRFWSQLVVELRKSVAA